MWRFAVSLLVIVTLPELALAADPWVAPADVASTATRALAAKKTARPGKTLRVAWVNKSSNVAKTHRDAKTKLRRAGMKVVHELVTTYTSSLTVAHPNGARAVFTQNVSHGALYVVARPTPARPPGKCVKIPTASRKIRVRSSAINQQGRFVSGKVNWHLSTAYLLDVDGDAIPDAFVPRARKHACPSATRWDIYVLRGKCGHYMGRIGPGMLGLHAPIAARKPSGFRVITLESRTTRHGRRGIPEVTETKTTFSVMRGKYRQSKRTQQTGQCHHCATSNCYSP